MLEIYNEQVRDLLDKNGDKKKGGLKIRQHPKNGFYRECDDFMDMCYHLYSGLEIY